MRKKYRLDFSRVAKIKNDEQACYKDSCGYLILLVVSVAVWVSVAPSSGYIAV
jgi:hypothetical protein